MYLFRRLDQIAVFLWIFSIPTSLAYHFNKSEGLVHGILVDYRIPQVSASFILFLVAATLCLMTKKIPKKTAVIALITALLFQSGLALYQFRSQHTLLGNLPFGEVDFKSSQIAKGIFFNGAIYELPYGTTVHPNILAGFVVISFLILTLQKASPVPKKYLALLFLDAAFICFLTQSMVASVALLLGYLTIIALAHRRIPKVPIRLAIIFLPLFSFIFFSWPKLMSSPNPSFSRRAQLQSIATKMIYSHPVFGIGWNNFTLLQESYGYIPGATRFLQPPHNVFLLLVTELGALGWLINILLGWIIWKLNSKFLPLTVAFVTLASFDHYLLTLTTGRMLLVLGILFYIFRRRNPRIEV